MGQQFKQLLRLAFPLAVMQLGFHLTGLVDAAVAGRINETALGAVGMGGSAFFAVMVLGFGLVMGVDPLVSQALGGAKQTRAWQVVRHGLILAAIITPLISLLILAVIYVGLPFFTSDADLLRQTQHYTLARLPAVFPMLA